MSSRADHYTFVLCASLSLIPVATSKFTEPSSETGDWVQKWFLGGTINLAWEKGWDWGGDEQPDFVDLFITWFADDHANTYWELLTANISTETPGEFDWKVDVPGNIVDVDSKFVFRLIAHTDPPVYLGTGASLPSRGFNLYPNPSASASSSSTSSTATRSVSSTIIATSTILSSSSAASTTTDPSPSVTPISSAKSSNVGAIVGGIAGGLAGLALLGVAVLFTLKRVKEKRKIGAGSLSEGGEAVWVPEAKPAHAQGYVPVWTGAPPELDGFQHTHDHPDNELDASRPRQYH